MTSVVQSDIPNSNLSNLIEQFSSRSRPKAKNPTAAATATATAAATKKEKKKRGPSIQALGHSYAAARPVRKCSEQNPYGWGGGLQQMMEMYPCDQCEKTFPQPYRWVGMWGRQIDR